MNGVQDNDKTDAEIVQDALEKLLDKSPLGKFVKLTIRSEDPTTPLTTLMHIGFKENLGNTLALADFLWTQALNYALTRRRREQIRARLEDAPPGDISAIAAPVNAARDAFIQFHKDYPSRASEVGEVLAYCIAVNDLGAAQVAAKMSLKTSGNMPVHGLDGIHAKVEAGALYVFFLESKLSQSANAGVKDYAESVAGFGSNLKQYLLEYSIVRDLGNLDSLTGAERDLALACFDVMDSPDTVERRERSVGVILYKENQFEKLSPVKQGQPVGFHEAEFVAAYASQLAHHQNAALKHLAAGNVDTNKCQVYFVAVPDVDELREQFYQRMGYIPKVKE
ncbi:DUF1837 domain-containing protein [Pseudomonas aeruginosa]|uniref:HamA C-terminal domain-containing protein n=1 Tax=Pseudomonas aeruginosa TaxID=287 RepID=UPI000445E8AC|nr:DUF1837 domain-containing protein [Pseudomonas aeruginosa]EZO81480.1 hypothetical protein V556_04080 [Pseudomonas aeruginosa BWH055]MBG6730178.1 DUF1837 domain-containing protein [Pseudomonas aeruginosa]MBX5747837.1 DUF1837 domain-containing protein [Pseudomonas aeruginosa]MCT5437045.1 DUF1837 domain-containing protein [Pseudomonas aeruginosa]MCT5586971.1 DUF1837 domain-containing protein [Pseudomonas aeruginosa]